MTADLVIPGPAAIQMTPSYSFSGCLDNNPKILGVDSVTWTDLPALTQISGAAHYLSAAYRPVIDLTSGGQTVYVN